MLSSDHSPQPAPEVVDGPLSSALGCMRSTCKSEEKMLKNLKQKTVVITACLAFLLLSCQAIFADQTDKEAALAAAEDWLALVDGAKYAASWQDAAAYFKRAVAEDQWTQSMTAFRRPLGKVLSRTLASQSYTRTLPGAPDENTW